MVKAPKMVESVSQEDTKIQTTAITLPNEEMFERGVSESQGSSKGIMSEIYEIKPYNPAPNEKEDAEKAGKFRVKLPHTGDIVYIDGPIKINVLRVSKVKQGSVPLMNEFGDTVLDEKGNTIKKYFFTNEFSPFASKDEVLGFKSLGGDVLGFWKRSDFEAMITARKLNGADNVFYKQGITSSGEPFKSSHISDKYVIYGIMVDGPYAGEYFKTYLNINAYGKTWSKDAGQIEPDEGSLLYTVNKGLLDWNKILESRGKDKVSRLDLNQCDVIYDIMPIEMINKKKEKKITYTSNFEYDNLTLYRTNNKEQVEFIKDLTTRYLIQEFGGIKAATMLSIGQAGVSTTLSLPQPEAIQSSDLIADAEIEIEDVQEVFQTAEIGKIAKAHGAPF